MKAPVRVHAPAMAGSEVDRAYCRFIAHACIARKPQDVTCQACRAKIEKYGTPFTRFRRLKRFFR